jgi:mono/diheme cytochrome c family protein
MTPKFSKSKGELMKIKIITPALLAATGLTMLSIVSVGARSNDDTFDAAKTYKGKCVACHGPKADKKFDAAKPDDENIQIILKGKKAEKPPHMPEYESKGVTAEQAKALLDYMKSLKQ